jgi:hypothetical protein
MCELYNSFPLLYNDVGGKEVDLCQWFWFKSLASTGTFLQVFLYRADGKNLSTEPN